MFTLVRIIFGQHWNKDAIPMINDYEQTFGEYIPMGKLTAHISTTEY